MLEQQDVSVIFYAHYIDSKVGKTGLTVTIDVWEVQRDGTRAEIVTAGNATEIGDGFYFYILAAGSVNEPAEYLACFKTVDTDVDQRDLPAIWFVDRAGVENLDKSINALNDISVVDVTQRQIPDSYAADGARPTIEQALLMIWQYLAERAVSGTTVTVNKPDGSTQAMTFTLSDGSDPTSITRSG